MTAAEKKFLANLQFVNGHATVKTASGKKAHLMQNGTNIRKPMFQLYMFNEDGDMVVIFNRGGVQKAIQRLAEL